jgi:uncharacterized protein YkwD
MARRTRAVLGGALVTMTLACTPPAGVAGNPAGAPADATSSWEVAMLSRINAERSAVGAPPLAACGTLRRAAQGHSLDQASHSTMTHTGSDGSTLRQRAERSGYLGWTSLGENVAYGYGSVDAVMNGWMGSSGHRANLLNASFTHVGVGQVAGGNGTPYWTQDFGRAGIC